MPPRTADRPLVLAAFLASLLALPLACAGAPSDAKVGAEHAPVPEAGRLAQDVRWLADDAREGRRAGTAGEELSAHWLAQRLEALGLEPAGTDGFLQSLEVPLPVRDGGGSTLTVSRADQSYGYQPPAEGEPAGLMPLFCSAGGAVEGPLVFAGYGISDADLGRDDYEGLDASGAVVLLVRGTPPDALLPETGSPAEAPVNPHGAAAAPPPSGWGGAGGVFHKVMEAKRRGARAVILAQHPARDEAMLAFAAGGGAEAKIPALHVSAAVAENVLPGYAERVARLDEGAAPPADEMTRMELSADVVRERGTAHNVLGLVRGRSRERVLVVGAHFDHLGRGGSGSLAAADQQGEIHNGADDNASGTAAVLEVARCLADGPPPERDVLVAFWSGEELGLLGSEHWARAPTVPLERIAANLNLDMVGRAGGGKLSVLGAGSAREFSALLARAGPRADLALEVSLSGQGVGGSDHQTFLKRGIPALHFFSGLHADYHRPSDDYERVEPEGAARVAGLVLELVGDIAALPALAFVPPAKEAPGATPGGFKTRFGSIPDYAYDGKGMRLDGTSPGGPAEKAGLMRGDVIVAVGDQAVEGVGDFMHMLNTHKPGDVVVVRFLREGAEETFTVTLESSQVE